MRHVIRAWLELAFVMAFAGCADDTTREAQSDVTSDVTVEPPGADAGRAGNPGGADAMPPTFATLEDYSPIVCTTPVAPTGPAYPTCDGTVRCGGEAQCVPTEVVAAGAGAGGTEMFPLCSTGKCLPTAYRQGKVRFKPCVGELGDGRCVAQCVAITRMPLSSILKTGAFGCGREEVCAPCAVAGVPNELCTRDTCAE